MDTSETSGQQSDTKKGSAWPWGFSLGKRGALFHREITQEEVAQVRDFNSLCDLIVGVRSSKSASGSVATAISLRRGTGGDGIVDALGGLKVAIDEFTTFVRERLGRPEFDFYAHLLPLILSWATTIEDDYVKDLPLLKRDVQSSTTLSSRQIRHILANSFVLNVSDLQGKERFGSIDFATLYSSPFSISLQRNLCQLAYFYRAGDAPLRDITFSRFKLEVGDFNPPFNHSYSNLRECSIEV